jgi:hypothetical protein
LSKKYHPDVNPSPQAKDQFIAIHEAYKFLMNAGPTPAASRSSVAYDYDPFENAYQTWREKAKTYARQKAWEAEKKKRKLISDIAHKFKYVAIIIAIANALLIVDFFLPKNAHLEYIHDISFENENGKQINNQKEFQYADYVNFEFNNYKMRFKNKLDLRIELDSPVTIEATMIYNIPVNANFNINDTIYTYQPTFNIYFGFGFFYLIVSLSVIFFLFVIKNTETLFNLAIVISFFYIIQLIILLAI